MDPILNKKSFSNIAIFQQVHLFVNIVTSDGDQYDQNKL
jgi:hypothetical protein